MGLTEPEDTEDAMPAALNQIGHKVSYGQKPSQKTVKAHQAHVREPKPLTAKQIDWIVAQVQTGNTQLPELDALDDNDFVMV